MSSGADVEVAARRGVLVRLTGVTLMTLLVATAAHAAISPIEPWEGTVAPGESVTATFTVVDSFTSCFTVDTPPGFSATLDGLGQDSLPINCALSGTRVIMTVTADSNVSPGDYTVTITETALGGQLLDTHIWPVTVIEPSSPTTTTTHRATTSTSTKTTRTGASATTSTSSTTTPSSATTTTSPVAAVVTGTTPPTASSSSTDDGAPGASTESDAPAETDANAGTVPPGESTNRDEPEILAPGPEPEKPPYNNYPNQTPTQAQAALSDRLRDQIPGAIPPLITDAILSPIVIGEYLLHSVFDSTKRLLIPIAIATLIGLLMVWRMRTEIARDELPLSRGSVDWASPAAEGGDRVAEAANRRPTTGTASTTS